MSSVRSFPGIDYDRWKTTEPDEPTDELGLEDRCDACGAELCETCEGCTEGDREGCFACCVCESIPDDRWAAALDEAEDAAVDEAKVAEISAPPEERS